MEPNIQDIHTNIFNLAIRQREADITKERVEKILSSGANVILTTGGIDDLNTKYFVEKGAMGVRRVLKKDLKRIAKATGGKKNHKYLSYLIFIKVANSYPFRGGRRLSYHLSGLNQRC